MGTDNKYDLTKLTKVQSTGKVISDRFQEQVRVWLNAAWSPEGRTKQALLEIIEAKTYSNESYRNHLGECAYYHLLSSSDGNQMIFGFGPQLMNALANFHFGGNFECTDQIKDYPSSVEKKLIGELAEKFVASLGGRFKHITMWQSSLQSSHIEMILKKIPPKKFYEARFCLAMLASGCGATGENQIDLIISCLFTKQNPIG